MPRKLDAELRRALAARIRYYNEMGIYDFYRRPLREPEETASATNENADIASSQPAVAVTAIETQPPCPVFQPESSEEMTPRKAEAVAVPVAVEENMFEVIAVKPEQGEPFVGRAGQLPNNMIKAMGLERKQVYIANVVKCRPPGNRTPEREECDTCSPFLMRQIAVIKPKVVVALGAVAAKTLLAVSASMAQLRGRFYDFKPAGVRSDDPNWQGCKLAVTYHPAFLLRDPRQKGEAWKDLQMVMKELGLKAAKGNA